MKDRGAAVHAAAERVVVEDVAAHDRRGARGGQLGLGLGSACQGHDLVATRHQPLHERPAHHTAAACDEDPAHVPARSAEEKRTKYSTPDHTVTIAAMTSTHWSR